MFCPECGAKVVDSDIVCKKCGHTLKSVYNDLSKPITKKSRFTLVLLCWLSGGFTGSHLKYLGYEQEAKAYSPYGILNPMFYLWYITKHLLECVCVIFGKYRTDAYGNPVRYF